MTKIIAAAALTLMMSTASVFAAEHVVQMLNTGANGDKMVFEPNFVKAAVGDTIKFVPTDKGHLVESIKDALPEGAEPLKSKLNQEYTVTLTTEGVYLVKCTPHLAMGMVAAIQVGAPTNLDAIKAVKLNKPGAARLEPVLAAITQ
jgi:pseudoazurin